MLTKHLVSAVSRAFGLRDELALIVFVVETLTCGRTLFQEEAFRERLGHD